MRRLLLFPSLLSSLFLFSQAPSFSDASALLPSGKVSDHAVGVADMNGDGLDDIIRMEADVNGQGDAIHNVFVAFQMEGGAQFDEAQIGTVMVPGIGSADTWGLAIADLDGNGVNDLALGGFYNGVYRYLTSDDASSFEEDIFAENEIFIQAMNTFDIDNDGHLDMFLCDDNEISQILMNEGNGMFSEQSVGLNPESDEDSDNSGNYGSVFMDVDNNGHADLYIAKCRQNVTDPTDPRRINLLFLNDGNGNWTSAGSDAGIDSGAQSWCADFGDMDNDGDLDLFIGNHDVNDELFLNDGNGNFTEVTADAGLMGTLPLIQIIQSTWVDMNNDSFIDLLTMGTGGHHLAMNDGDGTFTIFSDLFSNFPTNSYALGDLNDDGYVDLYCTANGYGGWGQEMWEDRLFLNDGGDNHYIKIGLEGVESNPNGVGARITIIGPWGIQIREVKSGESYGISNSLVQHFGLGVDDIIPEIQVSWPSGTVDYFYQVFADQTLSIVEGSAPLSIQDLELSKVEIFPNPAESAIQLEVPSDIELSGLSYQIMDLQGRIAAQGRVESAIQSLQVHELATGSYVLRLLQDNRAIAQGEFVKQ